jgi:hypothetical protein
MPVGTATIVDPPKPTGTVPTLKQLCIAVIAANTGEIHSSHLHYGSVSCWLPVWEWILLNNRDSFRVFSMFASRFASEPKFKSHKIVRYNNHNEGCLTNLAKLRSKGIDLYKIPNCVHRIEPLFVNINVQQLSAYISQLWYSPLVLLDLLMIGTTSMLLKENMFHIFNIPNLVALNLSNNPFVDDNVMFNLCSCIKNGKLSKLSVVLLNNCINVTKEGIKYLLELDATNSCLFYFESDIMLNTSGFNKRFHNLTSSKVHLDYVQGSHWFKVDKDQPEFEIVQKLPLALKLNSLHRLYGNHIIPKIGEEKYKYIKQLKSNILIDFMVYPEAFQSDSEMDLLKCAWTSRINQRSNFRNRAFSYMSNNNYSKPVIMKTIKNEDNVPHLEVEEDDIKCCKPSGKVRTKSKSIKADAKSFFKM